jgi:hypothetical protein
MGLARWLVRPASSGFERSPGCSPLGDAPPHPHGNQNSKNSPHTPTFSFSVSPCTYYFDHFSCTSSHSIYTIDIPPRLRKLHNHFLYAIPFKLLLFVYLSRFFGEIR